VTPAGGRIRRDERGAALLLAIAFLVVVGGIGGALLGAVTSGVNGRTRLDSARDRQYAADAAIETAIARVRTIAAPGPALSSCGGPDYLTLNGKQIRVDCTNAPTLTFRGFLQRNVIFSACEQASPDVACGGSSTPIVLRAQVNYQAIGSTVSPHVTRTWIQSWSVNR
jgi:hypothetical protein